MWLYVAGKHEVHFGVENFRTNTEAGPWRTGFVFLPTEEQGEFLLQFYGDTELCQRLNPHQFHSRELRQYATFLKRIRQEDLVACQFPRTITDRKGTFAKPAG